MKNKKIFIIFLMIAMLTVISLFIYGRSKQRNNYETEKIQEEQNLEIVDNTENEINKDEPKEENNEIKEDTNIKMAVIGDIMCHNSQYKDAHDSKNNTYDFSYVFSDIKEYISSADIAIGNLETTFAGKERGYSNYPRFNTPEQLATNLKDFGIDVVSTANI